MRHRLQQLGWSEIDVIDEDLGRSAAGTATREGFERMVADVCLGKVGAVAAREVSRFARNSREWQQLVEVCRVVDTLLIDQETVYAPRQSNDRLLLGLKGSLNEYELDLLRQRSVQARREKAKRGELVISVPAGYIKTAGQRIEKDPDRRVREAINLVFTKFLALGSVRQTLSWFLEHDLQVPVRQTGHDLTWRRPAYRMLYRILTSPIYGGAYAYGKTEAITRYDDDRPRKFLRRKPRADWTSLIPDAPVIDRARQNRDWRCSQDCFGAAAVDENSPSVIPARTTIYSDTVAIARGWTMANLAVSPLAESPSTMLSAAKYCASYIPRRWRLLCWRVNRNPRNTMLF